MARRKRNRLLVPEAREALDALMGSVAQDKKTVASSLGIPLRPNGDNGNMTTRDAGRIGGQMGGSMVRKLVAIAEQQLVNPAQPTDSSGH